MWLSPLEDSESILVSAIENYFGLLWSRHYKKFDENRYAVRVLSMIETAIKVGHIPKSYNFCGHCPAELYFTNQPIPRTIIESYFLVIADFLMEKRERPDHVREREYKQMMENG